MIFVQIYQHFLAFIPIPSNRLCEKAVGVLRQSSARTVNERYFRYLAVRSFDGLRTGSEVLEGRTVSFHTVWQSEESFSAWESGFTQTEPLPNSRKTFERQALATIATT